MGIWDFLKIPSSHPYEHRHTCYGVSAFVTSAAVCGMLSLRMGEVWIGAELPVRAL